MDPCVCVLAHGVAHLRVRARWPRGFARVGAETDGWVRMRLTAGSGFRGRARTHGTVSFVAGDLGFVACAGVPPHASSEVYCYFYLLEKQ